MRMTAVLFLLLLILLLTFPEYFASCAREAMKVWGLDVVPSLFPYMVFCRLLSETLRKKEIPATWAVSFLGLLGGSPSGSAIISSYADSLCRRQILSLYALTGAVSPMFLIGSVGDWLHNPKVGLLLAFVQTISAIFSFFCASAFSSSINSISAASNLSPPSRSDPIRESLSAVFSVGGYIVLFSVLSGMSSLIPYLNSVSNALVHAVMEAAGGMHSLCICALSAKAKAVILAAASGFGGFSILFQNLFFLRPLGIGIKSLLPIAFARAACCAAAMSLLYPFIIS